MKLNLEGVGGGCRMSLMPSPETLMTNHGGVGDGGILGTVGATKFMRIIEEDCNSSGSSSIGNNSDDDDDREGDAESPYRYDHHNNNNNNKINNGSLDDALQALEEALPIRRGISTFYNGKSRSFTCLADVWPSSPPSIKDIAKPENAYTRKRRNLLASTLSSSKNKNRAFQLSNISIGRISKKSKTLTLQFASENEDHDVKTQPQFNKTSLLKKQNVSSMRSFSSMVNLHPCSSRFGLNSTEIRNC
ncbi:uncharacterized protein DDB_G0287625 [Cynara cardunculus var. scolymus]|uniref:Uncharacterized protein n=1 Tax=Cynara cardunculus var. scolymus TaxID=59895 RepID=A0A103Y2U7_CYNCS|nr:uncharacterized protein DDB_G0287625 [Cynara cardunculus var. scolymus]KVI01489.1 hypothetical protein Ccrd_020247 [Cynara cardunculus var. scolymus]